MKFVRSAQVRGPEQLLAALRFGRQLAEYLYARFALDLRVCAIPGSEPRVRWEFEVDGFHHITALTELIANDPTYWAMLETAQPLFFEGALCDAIVCLRGQSTRNFDRNAPRKRPTARPSVQVVSRPATGLNKPFAFAG